ncbi:DUF5519 family protein [Streptomyces sp. NBC_01017]|uniref:luciferase domain-containing protein n=1 Tax=Streptomyces sp. NBC_01017 TaxID=2903721 RepID=UPI00386F7D3C|nr:DUF5519 family protein [Streptomyces sp. NBC_01017]WSV35266.1 DUF5519 family protein [Streptomyces sp. NBC_01017]
MTLAAQAFAQLVSWPDLAEVEPSCGIGRGLGSAHREIVHFHSGREADLHLTVGVIRRFEEHLSESAAVRVVSASAWVTVRLDAAGDRDVLMTLVSLALQARQAWPAPGELQRADCNEQVLLAHDHRSGC